MRRRNLSCIAMLAAMVAAPPLSLAQDTFQSAPGPEAQQPRPRASHPSPAPQIREPAGAPRTTPSDAAPRLAAPNMDRVKQFASARNLPLPPDLQIVRPGQDVGTAVARFSGVWSGDNRWNTVGRQALLAVEAIDRFGHAVIVYSEGPPNAATYNQNPARWWRGTGNIEGNILKVSIPPPSEKTYTLFNETQLYGVAPPNPNATPPFRGSKIWLSRID